jgi:ADP-ribose pyrophosphatase
MFTHCLFLFAITILSAGQISYLDILDKMDLPKGDHRLGEIELISDPAEIEQIEEAQKTRLLKKGLSEKDAQSFSKVGIVAQDQYWIWVRDAVLFPGNVPGTYNRVFSKTQLSNPHPGVAVLTVMPDEKIALILTYRHATRSWEFELPRGYVNKGESLDEAAKRETKEETGLETTSVELLGYIAPDSGALAAIIPVYMARCTTQGLSDTEYSEVIKGVFTFTVDEILAGFAKGYMILDDQKIPLRDSYLAFALLQKLSRSSNRTKN